MANFVSIILRRSLPSALPLASRAAIATGITAGIYGQPIYRLLPLYVSVIRNGFSAFSVSPLGFLIPSGVRLSVKIIRKLLFTGILYRVVLGTVKTLVLWPFRVLVLDLFASLTPLKNYSFFKELNIEIYNGLKSLIPVLSDGLDSCFSWTTTHSSWLLAISFVFSGLLAYYKYDTIKAWLEPLQGIFQGLTLAWEIVRALNPNFFDLINQFTGATVKTVVTLGYAVLAISTASLGFVGVVGQYISNVIQNLGYVWEYPFRLFKRGCFSLFRKIKEAWRGN